MMYTFPAVSSLPMQNYYAPWSSLYTTRDGQKYSIIVGFICRVRFLISQGGKTEKLPHFEFMNLQRR